MEGISTQRSFVHSLGWLALVGLSVLCLAVTFLYEEIATAQGPAKHAIELLRLHRFGFGGENSIGSWWAGTLLLLAGLHALDGFVRERHRAPSAARAWLFLSIVLVALSLDEIGSLHERVEKFVPPFDIRANLPFAGVLGVLVAYALAVLWRLDRTRGAARLISAGFLLFATVPLQEMAPHGLPFWPEAESLRVLLEEGTETVAMLLLILAASRNSAGIFDRSDRGSEPVLQSLDLHAAPLSIAFLAMVVPIVYTTTLVAGDNRGLPANWLGGAAYLAAGLVALRPTLQYGVYGRRQVGDVALATVCVAMSVIAVAYLVRHPLQKAEILLLGCTATSILWLVRRPRGSKRAHLATSVVLFLPAIAAAIWPSQLRVMLAFGLSGWIAYLGTRAAMRTFPPCAGRRETRRSSAASP